MIVFFILFSVQYFLTVFRAHIMSFCLLPIPRWMSARIATFDMIFPTRVYSLRLC